MENIITLTNLTSLRAIVSVQVLLTEYSSPTLEKRAALENFHFPVAAQNRNLGPFSLVLIGLHARQGF